MIRTAILFFFLLYIPRLNAQQPNAHMSNPSSNYSVFLRSQEGYQGHSIWKMKKAGDVNEDGSVLSMKDYQTSHWYKAIVPGTVLTSLVDNKIFPDPYFGDNNRKTRKLIPDISEVGREFYHYWFRTEFTIPKNFSGKRIWLKFHGINYRCEIWMNGKNLGKMAGMFNSQSFDVTSITDRSGVNALAVSVLPVDVPGSSKLKDNRPGAFGENKNGGDGEIGKNVTMLMSAGWDFTVQDGIRDRNTGIWRDVELFATGDVTLENPFIQTQLPLPDTTSSKQTISVEVVNHANTSQSGIIRGTIAENKIAFSKKVTLAPNERRIVVFSPSEYEQLLFRNPRLWWPVNKGKQNLYTLNLSFVGEGNSESHSISTKFGIREITSDQNTPDHSRRFLVNGYPMFVRGTNWVPEAMLKNSEERTYAELRYTRQAGINFIRLWGGGIAESDYFFQLCDEYGILVWTEYWMTGDTHSPVDTALYFMNIRNTVKRIRNHPSLAYYVSSNESTEVPGAPKVFHDLDSTRGYQMQSECCGVHDGSPYKYENPMQYFENTASARGSRVDGFNPEYGTPCLPTVESLRRMMPEKDLWPVNDSVWKYLDGGGFHQVASKYKDAVDQFGKSSSIEEFAKKAQFVGAMNYRSIWEVWNYNKFGYGDRFASGFLFWYHNSPLPQVAGRLYDYYLQPTAALYYSQNGLQPIHPQFDYLKNTVSVYNDYRKEFHNLTVEATVYTLDAQKVWTKTATLNLPSDAVANDVMKIDFPENISQVHFIKLILKDASGKILSDAFYWRSKDLYKGAWTLTGPAVSGFSDINRMPAAELVSSVSKKISAGKVTLTIHVVNPSKSIAFFSQLRLKDNEGNLLCPVFYSDNFFCLLPGESKTVTAAFEIKKYTSVQLLMDAWNVKENKQIIIF